MDKAKFDLTAIGNAIVDVLSPTTDEFIASHAAAGMNKGGMMLIDTARAKELYGQMGPATEMSGGSAGNTMAAFASLGGKGAYIGKVADDQLGDVFRHDMRAMNVHFETQPLALGAPTARCLILVTPDAQRTMNTYLGACVELTENDIDEEIIANSQITYLEGYLFDPPLAKKAFWKAAEIVAANNRKLALTLSDSFCVSRHRDDFKKLIEQNVDILFANEEEIKSLYETESFDEAVQKISGACEIAVITRGAKGSLIITPSARHEIAAIPPAQLVDTTGAGDAYAAGFLYGLTSGKSLPLCGQIGALAASNIIAQMGPRPAGKLSELLPKLAA